MKVQTFFHRALLTPLFVAVLGYIVFFALASEKITSPLLRTVGDLAGLSMLASLFAFVPFSLYAGAVYWIARPQSERVLRLALWLAPLTIGAGFASAMFFGSGGSLRDENAIVALPGMAAPGLIVGYLQVIAIELALIVARRRNWVER